MSTRVPPKGRNDHDSSKWGLRDRISATSATGSTSSVTCPWVSRGDPNWLAGLRRWLAFSSWSRKADRYPTWEVSLTLPGLHSEANCSTPGGSSVREQALRFQNYRRAASRFLSNFLFSLFELRRQIFALLRSLPADESLLCRSARSKNRPSSAAAWRQ